MAIIKPTAATVKWFGYSAIAIPLIDGIAFWSKVFSDNWQPSSPGLHAALSVVALVGVIAVIVAECLRILEERIAQLERSLLTKNPTNRMNPE